ncbi:putative cucumisin [Medicago truncatula]|uniref:Putative cucumisin n=1 Tax=Medicago truncatula TaxID=3880 RepID=A0A396H4M7_MEDTR|nr:putative cucumisin [Medicago truncatula]
MIYSYTKNINGFAALLEEKEAADIAEHPNVVSVLLNRGRKLHTTHSWEFMSMEHNGVAPSHSLFRKARYGEDVIIGNLDSGNYDFFSLVYIYHYITSNFYNKIDD